METRELLEQQVMDAVLELLAQKDYRQLRSLSEELQPADLAELLEDMEQSQRLLVFRLLKKEVAAEAFSYMDAEERGELVEALSDAKLTEVLEEMALDDAADLLEEMPASVVKRVLGRSSKETRDMLNQLLHYPEDSAGSIMNAEYVRLGKDLTVEEAFAVIRRVGENAETVYTCYVVERNRLIGVVTARDLMLANPDDLVTDLMDENIISVNVTDDKEFVANEMNRYGFMAMPVVDSEGMLVGIVTLDDATDVLIEEATEDIQGMAAIHPSEDSYFATSVFAHARNRIPWLLVLMLSATFTGMILNHYESAFAAVPLLVSFIPMLMDTGGNCGNQSSVLMVRGMALGDIEPRDAARVAFKELRVALVVGGVLALVNGIRVLIMYKDMRLAILIAVSLLLAVVIAKLIGCTLPLAVQRIGLDPALMASPFITTIVDACSITIYFGIATKMFQLTGA